MAGVKISALPPATTPLLGNELVPIVQSGVTKHVSASDFGNSTYVAKTSDTGQALMPAGTISERDTGSYGALRYNTTTQLWEYWAGIGWFDLNPVPTAAATSFTPYGTIEATTVQTAIQELLDESVYKTGLNGSAELPAGTTAQRDETPAQGAIRYNSTLSVWEGWNGSAWVSFGISGGSIGPASDVTFTPYGNISSTNVQSAIQELDDETVKKTSSTGSAVMPVGTTAQRDGTPSQGYMRYNSTLSVWESWSGSAWVPFVLPTTQTAVLTIACSNETTALTTGAAKVTFRMPHAMTLTAVRASLTTAQASGSIFTVDINEAGTSVLSTKITIDNTEKSSVTAATQPVISDSALADDAEITIDIDQVGTSGATGLKVYLIGTYA